MRAASATRFAPQMSPSRRCGPTLGSPRRAPAITSSVLNDVAGVTLSICGPDRWLPILQMHYAHQERHELCLPRRPGLSEHGPEMMITRCLQLNVERARRLLQGCRPSIGSERGVLLPVSAQRNAPAEPRRTIAWVRWVRLRLSMLLGPQTAREHVSAARSSTSPSRPCSTLP